jgi:threonine/homoserine/homoserine lactone efflux protein
MMSPTVALLAYVAASAVLIVTPGLDTALVLRTTAVEGPRRGAYTAVGICCGLLIWGLAVALGVSAVLAASHVAYLVLRAIGAVYLIWLGLSLLLRPRVKTPVLDTTPPADRGTTAWFVRGLLSNLTNPKVGVFFVTILPQFVPSGVAVGPFIALLVTIHVTESVLWLGLLIVATRSIAQLVCRPAVTRTLDRATGAVLVGAGLRLAAEGRH